MAPLWISSSQRYEIYTETKFYTDLQFNMLDLIEEKTVLDNCANFLDKALKEAKTPADLFLTQTPLQLK